MAGWRFDTEQDYRRFVDAYNAREKRPQEAQRAPLYAGGGVKPADGAQRSTIRRCPTEEEEQMALIAWVRLYTGKWPALAKLFHPANGGSRHILEAVKFKALGVLPAIPDLILLYPSREFHAWCGELKALDGKPTPAQRQMKKELCALGYDADIYYGWEAARDSLVRYLTVFSRRKPGASGA